ncbi:MAG: glycosyltransferase [Oscillospiraceae bacterium]|nr:glycosyltransferase [Oscillospiraceae bacterium]
MTTYDGEDPDFLDAALDSVLVRQTVKPTQLVLVLDGPINDRLQSVVSRYEALYGDIVAVVRCAQNRGPGPASAEGMKYIRHDLVARMDSDDICVENRFERELAVMGENPGLSVVSGWISEFATDPMCDTSIRVVPETHEQIIRMFPKRMPMNNVAAMIRREAIEQAGGYGRDTVNEDYSLYARIWVNGGKFYNIQDVLVKVRVGNGMTARRGDLRIFRDWCKDQRYLRQHGKQSWLSSWLSCLRCLVFVLLPSDIKSLVYKFFLRKST